MIEFVKDKETKSKIRYTAKGEVSGSIYVDKESELAKDAEIVLAAPGSTPARAAAPGRHTISQVER